MALHGERVEQPHAGKERVVAGGEHAGEDDGVDDTAGGVGACHFEDDGEGRGAAAFGAQAGVVVGDVETDEKDREDTVFRW